MSPVSTQDADAQPLPEPEQDTDAQPTPDSAPDGIQPVPEQGVDAQPEPSTTPDADVPTEPASTAVADMPVSPAPCRPWQPSDSAWSSLPTSRPARLGGLSATTSGTYLYSVGTWWDEGDRIRGILRSNDLGETWCVIETPSPITAVTVSHAGESILYAITQPPYGEPAQLLKSTDAGATWTDVGPVPEASVYDGLLATGSVDPEAVWFGYQLSLDSGATWTEVMPPALDSDTSEVATTPEVTLIARSRRTVLVDPQLGRKLLVLGEVTTFFSNGESEVNYPWFTSDDAGETWQEIDAPPDLGGGTVALEQVFIDAASNLYAQQSYGLPLYRSSDWGETWDEMAPLPAEGLSIGTLDASQGGVLFSWSDAPDSRAWRSVDAGMSWQALTLTNEFDVALALAPTNGDVIVSKTSVSLAATTNGGDSWQQRSIIPLSQTLVASPSDPNELFTVGNSSLRYLSSTDNGLTWIPTDVSPEQLLPSVHNAELPEWIRQLGYPRGEARCMRPATCLFVLLDSGPLTGEEEPLPHECYLVRTDDGGSSFDDPVIVPIELCRSGGKLAVSPTDEQHLMVPCNEGQFSDELVLKVCTSWDGGVTWESNALGVEPSTPEDNVVSSIFVSDEVVLATTGLLLSGSLLSNSDYNGEVLRSIDGGTTWSPVLDHGGSNFSQSTAHPETVFLTAGVSHYTNLLFRSDDAGANWTLVSPGGPVVNPELDNQVTRPEILSIVDRPDGGFLITTEEGLVQFN